MKTTRACGETLLGAQITRKCNLVFILRVALLPLTYAGFLLWTPDFGFVFLFFLRAFVFLSFTGGLV